MSAILLYSLGLSPIEVVLTSGNIQRFHPAGVVSPAQHCEAISNSLLPAPAYY